MAIRVNSVLWLILFQILQRNLMVDAIRDVNRFWSSMRKLKSSRQIDADGAAIRRSEIGTLYGPRSSGINGAKSCILSLSWHLISLLKLHFLYYFSHIFSNCYFFWLYCGSDSGTSICWLQRCIKILFLQCNLTWKTEQLTNYKCSLIQYGDESDSEVFLKKPSRDIANQGFAIFPMKVRKYIIKVKHFASLLFRLINANISVNEQPEWFHTSGHFIQVVLHV